MGARRKAFGFHHWKPKIRSESGRVIRQVERRHKARRLVAGFAPGFEPREMPTKSSNLAGGTGEQEGLRLHECCWAGHSQGNIERGLEDALLSASRNTLPLFGAGQAFFARATSQPAHRRRRSCGAQPDYRPHANRSPGVDRRTRQLDHACGFRGLVRLPAHREPLDLDTVAAAPAIDQGPPLFLGRRLSVMGWRNTVPATNETLSFGVSPPSWRRKAGWRF